MLVIYSSGLESKVCLICRMYGLVYVIDGRHSCQVFLVG